MSVKFLTVAWHVMSLDFYKFTDVSEKPYTSAMSMEATGSYETRIDFAPHFRSEYSSTNVIS